MSIQSVNLYIPFSPEKLAHRLNLSISVEKIRTVAKSALAQLTIALAVNVAFCAVFGAFFAPPSLTALTVTVGAVLTVTLMTLAVQGIWSRCQGLPVWWEKFSSHLARASLVTTLTLKLNRYLHECGHAGAALMTYVKAEPQIMASCRHGQTSYNISYGLTRFGKLLGENRALLFTTAAGLAAPVLLAMAEFAIAYNIGDNHPTLSSLLTYHGISQLLDTILYCSVLALNSSKDFLMHDSIMLWQMGGIHPLVTLALVIALPLAELALFKLINKQK